MKYLVSIILILNIFAGYAAEAYQGDYVDCQTTHQTDHTSEKSSSSDPVHSEHECLAVHCHFGHCTDLVAMTNTPLFFIKLTKLISGKVLNPKEYISEIFRPPIAV